MKPTSFVMTQGRNSCVLGRYTRSEFAGFLKALRERQSLLVGMRIERRGLHSYTYRMNYGSATCTYTIKPEGARS
jgi:hypothetical protein